MNDQTNELVLLSDSGLTVATEGQDIRGRDVKDSAGEDLGKVDDLLIDGTTNTVRFLVVASGGFLGLGEQKSFIPVDALTAITDDDVTIGQTREHVAGAPAYDPALINDRDYGAGVFSYWGYDPYWAPGYQPPVRLL